MTLAQLRLFILVADHGGFTGAAAAAGVGQSAVSHAIKGLEQDWNVSLFDRQGGRVTLTEIGHILLPRAREMLGLSETIGQEIAAYRGLSQGHLRIGSFGPTSSILLLPTILQAFRRRYPRIDVTVDEGTDEEVIDWVLGRRVDVGFVVLPDDRFDTVALLEDQFIAVLPASHRLANRDGVALAELKDDPFIMTHAGSGAVINAVFRRRGFQPRIQHYFSQVVTILDMVQRGEGVSVIAQLALTDVLAKAYPGIVAKPLKPQAKRSVGLAVRNQPQAPPAVRAFIDIARPLFRRTGG